MISRALEGDRQVCLGAEQVALAAKCGYFGLTVWYAFEEKPGAPAGPKRKGWRAPK